MQIFVIALVFGIFIHDSKVIRDVMPENLIPAAWLVAIVLLPKLILGAAYAFQCRFTTGHMGQLSSQTRIRWLDRNSEFYRWSLLGLYGLDLWAGLLHQSRLVLGNSILIDELVVMTPTLTMVIWAWWAYYPVDRSIREASLIGQIDAGLPVWPILTRRHYLISQIRHQLTYLFVPLMLVLAWSELVRDFAGPQWDGLSTPALFAGLGCVVLFAPVMIRWLWDTTPLPPGRLRHMLTQMCQRHRVGVRELLVWRTFGGMINAAVMGLVGPLRYILLTDALLESMPHKQVEAVMAHEIAHVRRGHMFWLLAVATTLLLSLQLLWTQLALLAVKATEQAGLTTIPLHEQQDMVSAVAMVASMANWLAAFGWVSRRFERQADTFAVQHLSSCRAETAPDQQPAGNGTVAVDDESVHTMSEALAQVAALNHIAPNRRSWRHGSIAWRRAYLQQLVGQPINRLSIDQLVFKVKLLACILGGMLLGGFVFLEIRH